MEEKSLFDRLEEGLKLPEEWQVYLHMRPGGWQNIAQIAFDVHCRHHVKCGSEHYRGYIQKGLEQKLIEARVFNPLGGNISVTFYRLTAHGEELHRRIEQRYIDTGRVTDRAFLN